MLQGSGNHRPCGLRKGKKNARHALELEKPRSDCGLPTPYQLRIAVRWNRQGPFSHLKIYPEGNKTQRKVSHREMSLMEVHKSTKLPRPMVGFRLKSFSFKQQRVQTAPRTTHPNGVRSNKCNTRNQDSSETRTKRGPQERNLGAQAAQKTCKTSRKCWAIFPVANLEG